MTENDELQEKGLDPRDWFPADKTTVRPHELKQWLSEYVNEESVAYDTYTFDFCEDRVTVEVWKQGTSTTKASIAVEDVNAEILRDAVRRAGYVARSHQVITGEHDMTLINDCHKVGVCVIGETPDNDDEELEDR